MPTTKLILFLFPCFCILALCKACQAQNQHLEEGRITYYVNENVKNSSELYFMEISERWKEYLNSRAFLSRNQEFWNTDGMPFPVQSYIALLLHINDVFTRGMRIQCTILGIIPAKNGHFLVNTMYSEYDKEGGITKLNYIITFYARKVGAKYEFVSSLNYLQEIYERRKVGSVNYLIHPEHQFSLRDAERMNKFNNEIAQTFKMNPIAFDYVVANNTSDLSEMMGIDFFSYSFQPNQSGGQADLRNRIILAGNGSAYYPHELVHLYIANKFGNSTFHWVDEGVAAYFGGSTGYDIEWHWEKLKRFLLSNDSYPLQDLSALETHIPNGDYTTDFRYAIGALLIKQVIESSGMEGVFEAIKEVQTEEDYFLFLERELGVSRETFEEYIRSLASDLLPLNTDQMSSYKY